MISPTGRLDIRGQDRWGHGGYGRPRGTKVHHGVDFVIDPNNNIYFPFQYGFIERIAKPYAQDDRYSGVLLNGRDGDTEYIAKIFYFQPELDLIKHYVGVRQGYIIGESQDLNERYPGITNHIHMQVALAATPRIWTNPIALLEGKEAYERLH